MHSAVCTSRVKTTIHAMSSPFMQHHSQISIVTNNSDFPGTFRNDIEKNLEFLDISRILGRVETMQLIHVP